MKVTGITTSRFCKFTAGFVFLVSALGPTGARAQAPYLLPYTISSIAGGGVAPTLGATCTGANGTSATAEDVMGDGCLANSSSVVTNSDIHDVGVDPVGNVYFIDIGSYTVLREIEARSGIINVVAGTFSTSSTAKKVCSSTIDEYGDNCTANDGMGNVSGANTANIGKSRGVAVAKNGDIFIAAYGSSLVHKVSASTGKMTLVAGYETGTGTSAKGAGGYTGDGGPATSAEIYQDRGVAVDAMENIYIADTANNVVRMVSASTGNISTIVGTNPGTGLPAPKGSVGDGGPATAAELSGPEDVEVDASGDLFIGDFGNNKVRVVYEGGPAIKNLIALTNGGEVAQAGYIYTVVGGGTSPYTAGSIVLSTSIAIGNPRKLSVDARGNIYVADNTNNVVWFVDATTGYMRILGGTYGMSTGSTCTTTDAVGDNCQATLATLNSNFNMGIGVDLLGNVYVSDSGDRRVRKISLNSTFPAVASGNSDPQTLIVHFAVADSPAASSPFTIAGSTDFAVSGTPACTTNPDNTTDCTLSVVFTPTRPGADAASLLVKSTLGQSVALALSGSGIASSVALDPGTAASVGSSLSASRGIAQDSVGNVYVADTGNNRVVEFAVGGASTVIAGTGTSGYSGDGAAATAAKLAAPKGVAVTPDGAVYIADTGNNVIRRVDPVTGFISTFGGGASAICAANNDPLGDGCLATSAKFSAPTSIVSDAIGNLYVSDTGNNVIREIGATGYVFLVAGGATPPLCASADTYGNGCAPTQTIFNSPTGLAIDSGNNLYIADTGNNEVRVLTAATDLVHAFAGTGQSGGSGNGGLATTAQVDGPTGLALDAAANLYIADTGNHVIRVVNASGDIDTVVGTLGSSGTGTVPGLASGVLLNLPGAVVSSGIGKLNILDTGNNRLVSLDRGSVSLNFGRTNVGASSPATTIQETGTGSSTATLGYPLFVSSGSTAVFTLAAYGTDGCSSSSSLPQTLAPGVSCALSAQFTPTAIGPMSATYTESNATTVNLPAPFISISGTGAVLTKTTLTTAVTTPATGNPQYSIPFVVTATLHPAVCDPTAPDCTAAGTVTFYLDGTQVGLPVAVSNTGTTSSNVITASATINGQSVGSHTVVAIYSGDTYYASSTSLSLPVSVAQGSTTTVVSATPAISTQFSDLTLSAQVASSTGTVPTGTIAFYAGTTFLKSVAVDPGTGIATASDVFSAPLTIGSDGKPHKIIGNVPTSFGLTAGSYNLTAVYSGDSNFAVSTSAGVPLTLNPDPQGFAVAQCLTQDIIDGCTPPVVGTAQGSTATALIYVIPSNTLNGTLSFSCTGLPANSVCTFGATTSITQPGATQLAGSTLIFTPVAGSAVPGVTVPGAAVVAGATALAALPPSLTVTLWTDVNSNVNTASNRTHSGSTMAGLLGWPMLLGGFAGIFGFRKRLRHTRLLAVLALVALLTGSAMVMTGCASSISNSGLTPTGTYMVTLTVNGPNGLVQTTTIPFTVGKGLTGQM